MVCACTCARLSKPKLVPKLAHKFIFRREERRKEWGANIHIALVLKWIRALNPMILFFLMNSFIKILVSAFSLLVALGFWWEGGNLLLNLHEVYVLLD